MAGMPYGMSGLLSQVVLPLFLGLLLPVLCYSITVAMGDLQERRPKKHQRRGKKRHARAFVLRKSSHPSMKCCPIQLEMECMYETVHQFKRTIKDLTRCLNKLGRLDWEMLESSNSSWSTIATSEVSSNSGVFLSSLREETYTSITEVSHVSDDSWTTITTRDIVCSSWECLTTLVDKADMTHASSVQPGLENPSTDLENPSTDLEKQPGPASHPPCNKEVDICLEASSVQQHQGDLNIQLSAPTPPPEEPEVNSREMGMPFHHNKGQETLEGPITESKLKQELGRPANVDEAPQHVPASAPPTPRRQEQHDVSIIPILWNPPFLDMAMKSKLEHHIVKRKIQKHYGLQTRILECEESFASVIWNRKASQPSPLQQYPGLPYHSHFQHWNRNAQKGGHQDSPWTVRRVYTTCRCMPATDGGFSPFWASSIGEENES